MLERAPRRPTTSGSSPRSGAATTAPSTQIFERHRTAARAPRAQDPRQVLRPGRGRRPGGDAAGEPGAAARRAPHRAAPVALPPRAQLRARRARPRAHGQRGARGRRGARRAARVRRDGARGRPASGGAGSATCSATSRRCPSTSATRCCAARSTASRTPRSPSSSARREQATKNARPPRAHEPRQAGRGALDGLPAGAAGAAGGARPRPARVGGDLPPPRHLPRLPGVPRPA